MERVEHRVRIRARGVVLALTVGAVFATGPASLASASQSWPFGYTQSSIDQGIKNHIATLFKLHNVDSVSCVAIKSFRPGNVFHCSAYNDSNVLIGYVKVKILKHNEENISWKPTSAEAASTGNS
jgi:hypothetical protein